MAVHYPWTRYWIPLGKDYPLDYWGFHVDPQSEYYRFHETVAESFDSISIHHCLILLGEPGLGKTWALKSGHLTTQQEMCGTRDTALLFDLGSYADQSSLVQGVFESLDVKDWMAGEHVLHLFLDSLDEGRLHIKPLAKILGDALSRLPHRRLKLRVACRSAEWPESFTSRLKQFWPEHDADPTSGVWTYRLVPLTRGDVTMAAEANAIASDKLLDSVVKSDLVPWAERPVTLDMLLGIFKAEKGLPLSRWEIYEKGCLRLCEDLQERVDAGHSGHLSAAQRRDIAGHVCFHLLFTNRAFIWMGPNAAPDAKEGLPRDDLLGESALSSEETIQIGLEDIQEAFNTGLFARKGENRLVPAHQTYAEFLVCRHLLRFDFPINVLEGLFLGGDGHLIPQLHELASWFIGKRNDFLDVVIMYDSEVLLRSDLSGYGSDVRRRILEGILGQVDETRVYRWGRLVDYEKLGYPDMDRDLSPWITKGRTSEARILAMDIALKCKMSGLSDELVSIALDQGETHEVRSNAAYAVAKIGHSDARLHLRPLACGQGGDDPDDALRGHALEALWPDLISAEELFCFLVKRKQENYIGSYAHFLYQLPTRLSPQHYPHALLWLARYLNVCELHAEQPIEDILLGACDYLDQEKIFDAFMVAVWHLKSKYHHVLRKEKVQNIICTGLTNNKLNREFVLGMCMECDATGDRIDLFSFTKFWKSEDRFMESIGWYMAERDEMIKYIISVFSFWLYDLNIPEHTKAVLLLSKTDNLFQKKYSWLGIGCILNSEESEKAKHLYYELNERREDSVVLQPVTEQNFRDMLLNTAENNDLWHKLRWLLTFVAGENNRYQYINFSNEEKQMWPTLSVEIQEQVLAAALRFINRDSPTSRNWYNVNSYSEKDFLGLDALNLLCAYNTDALDLVSIAAIETWAPDIIGLPLWDGEYATELRCKLIDLCFKKVAQQSIRIVEEHIRRTAAKHEEHLPDVFECLKTRWNSDFTGMIVDLIEARVIPPKLIKNFFRYLFEVDPLAAHEVATRQYQNSCQSGSEGREMAVAAASSLIAYSSRLDWSWIWPHLVDDQEFGEALLTELVYGSNRLKANQFDLLSESELSAFYCYLFDIYPNREDPELNGFVTARHEIGDLKRGILVYLARRGTLAAVDALEAIHQHSLELDWVRYHVAEAKEQLRRNLWIHFSSDTLKKLVKQRSGLFVQNGDQLLDVILSGLKTIEEKLHGHTPQARFLWDERNGFTPKDENAFSDYIVSGLHDVLLSKGIILNREVEIRRSGKGMGERVDIHVDAISSRQGTKEFDRLKVIIEVKCCWNKQLMTAMKEQLLERYMDESNCYHGLYLVGWFHCAKWSVDDQRSLVNKDMPLADARILFNNQAAEYSCVRRKISAYVMDATV